MNFRFGSAQASAAGHNYLTDLPLGEGGRPPCGQGREQAAGLGRGAHELRLDAGAGDEEEARRLAGGADPWPERRRRALLAREQCACESIAGAALAPGPVAGVSNTWRAQKQGCAMVKARLRRTTHRTMGGLRAACGLRWPS